MENKEDFAIGYVPISANNDEPKEMDDFLRDMAFLLLIAVSGIFDGTHPEEPENKE